MFFWLLLILLPSIIVLPLSVGFFANSKGRHPTTDEVAVSVSLGLTFTFFSCLAVFPVWGDHANDLAIVSEQHHRIAVFEQRIESITNRLQQFDYPEKPGVSVDSDAPWSSMVMSLTQAETQLAEAKDERALAIRSIEARRHGALSGVITLVGDYSH